MGIGWTLLIFILSLAQSGFNAYTGSSYLAAVWGLASGLWLASLMDELFRRCMK